MITAPHEHHSAKSELLALANRADSKLLRISRDLHVESLRFMHAKRRFAKPIETVLHARKDIETFVESLENFDDETTRVWQSRLLDITQDDVSEWTFVGLCEKKYFASDHSTTLVQWLNEIKIMK